MAGQGVETLQCEDNSMIATSDRRPGRFGALSSCDPRRRGARRVRETHISFQTELPGLRSFRVVIGLSESPQSWGAGPTGAISFLGNLSGAMKGLLSWPIAVPRVPIATAVRA